MSDLERATKMLNDFTKVRPGWAWASIQHQACLALFLCSDHSSTLLKWQLASCFMCFVQTWSSDNGWKYSHPDDLVSFWARLVELKYRFNVLTCISWKRAFFSFLEVFFSCWIGAEVQSMSMQQYDFKLLAAVLGEVNIPEHEEISISTSSWH